MKKGGRGASHLARLFPEYLISAILPLDMSKKKTQSKKILITILVILIGLIAYGIHEKKEHTQPSRENSSQQEQLLSEHLKWNDFQKMAESDNTVVIDIRTPEELAQGVLFPKVKNINYYDPTFEKQLAQLDPNKTYLIYCRSGHRSGNALPIFKRRGLRAHDLQGGYNAIRG